jgi:preprotein translocase subunit YajC
MINNFLANLPILLGTGEIGGGADAAGSPMQFPITLVMIGGIILVFYFLIIRPQNKKQKKVQQMLQALKKGDKAVTIGGIHGTITAVKEQTVTLKIDTNTKLEFSRSSISQILEKKDSPDEKVKQ